MPDWSGNETKNPAQDLANLWCNRFGETKQQRRYVKIFNRLLEDYSIEDLRKIIAVLHDRYEHDEVSVTSPAFIPYVAEEILTGKFLEGKRLEII